MVAHRNKQKSLKQKQREAKQIAKQADIEQFRIFIDSLVENFQLDKIIALLQSVDMYRLVMRHQLPDALAYLFEKNLVPDSELASLTAQQPNMHYLVAPSEKTGYTAKVKAFLKPRAELPVVKPLYVSHSIRVRQSVGRRFLGNVIIKPVGFISRLVLWTAFFALTLVTFGAAYPLVGVLLNLRIRNSVHKDPQLYKLEYYLLTQCEKWQLKGPLDKLSIGLAASIKIPQNDSSDQPHAPRLFGSPGTIATGYELLLKKVRAAHSVDAPAVQHTIQLIHGKIERKRAKITQLASELKFAITVFEKQYEAAYQTPLAYMKTDSEGGYTGEITRFLSQENLGDHERRVYLRKFSKIVFNISVGLALARKGKGTYNKVSCSNLFDLFDELCRQHNKLCKLNKAIQPVDQASQSQQSLRLAN